MKLKTKLLMISALVVAVSLVALPVQSFAFQPDAEYLVRENQFGEQWSAEDKQIREKLAALEKKFGKKPNIVFILGGRHRLHGARVVRRRQGSRLFHAKPRSHGR